MKKSMKNHIYLLVFAACLALIFSGCQNLMEGPNRNTSDIPPGMGYLKLTIDRTGAERTILPEIPAGFNFDRYELTIVKDGEVIPSYDDEWTQDDDPVYLEPGDYDLTLKAFIKDGDDFLLAAQGSDKIKISSGTGINHSIVLGLITDDLKTGEGTFKWEINFDPAGFDGKEIYASLAVYNYGDWVNNGAGPPPAAVYDYWDNYTLTDSPTPNMPEPYKISGSKTLDWGYYEVILTLEKENPEDDTIKDEITIYEILHVYKGLDSTFLLNLTMDYFETTLYTVTFVNYYHQELIDKISYVVHGHDVLKPLNPSRQFYSFNWWYDSNEDIQNAFDFSPMNKIYENKILNAYWLPEVYSITYTLDAGSKYPGSPSNGNPSTYTIETETFNLQNPLPNDNRYQFDGWYSNSSLTIPALTTITKGVTNDHLSFYAKWKINENYDGDGSEDFPFRVKTETELRRIGLGESMAEPKDWEGDWALNAYYIQTADITISGGWTPIGEGVSDFSGSYDGGGFDIRNLSDSLFEAINNLGEVKFLGVSGYITGGNNVGAITRYNEGWIEACYVFYEGSVFDENCVSVSGTRFIGGLVGTNAGTIINCYNDSSNVIATNSYVGGIAGTNSGTVENCYNTGYVVSTGNGIVGGIVGLNSGIVKNCVSLGPEVNGYNDIGRIAGTNSNGDGLINNRARVDMMVEKIKLDYTYNSVKQANLPHGADQTLNNNNLLNVFVASSLWDWTDNHTNPGIWIIPSNTLAEEEHLPRLNENHTPILPRGIRQWSNYIGKNEPITSLNFNSQTLIEYAYTGATEQKGWYLKYVHGNWEPVGTMLNEETVIDVVYTSQSYTITNNTCSPGSFIDISLGLISFRVRAPQNVSAYPPSSGYSGKTYVIENIVINVPHTSVEIEAAFDTNFTNPIPNNSSGTNTWILKNESFAMASNMPAVYLRFIINVYGQWKHEDDNSLEPKYHMVFKDQTAEFYYWKNVLTGSPMSIYGEVTSRDGFISYDPVGQPIDTRTTVNGSANPNLGKKCIIIHTADQFDYTQWVPDTDTVTMNALGLIGPGPDKRMIGGSITGVSQYLAEQKPHDLFLGTEKVGTALIETLSTSSYSGGTITNYNFKVTYILDPDPTFISYLATSAITASARTTKSILPINGIVTKVSNTEYSVTFNNLPFTWITVDSVLNFKP